MLGRLVHRAEFEQLLAAPPRWRSAHFAMHHVSAGESAASKIEERTNGEELSTGIAQVAPRSVDNLGPRLALGVVVPKRHAQRAVTRNLIRRVVRAAFALNAHALPAGRWLVRLKGPFAPRDFVSAASPPLAAAVRDEIDRLVATALRRPARGSA